MKKIFIVFILSSLFLYSEHYAVGNWYMVDKTDPITDEKEFLMFMEQQEKSSLNFNSLIIKIKEDSININLYTPSLLYKERFNDDDKIELIYRLDKNEPKTMSINKYGESEIYSLTNSQSSTEKSIIFLKELLSSDTLAIRAIETVDNIRYTYTYVYELSKLKDYILLFDFDGTVLENYKNELTYLVADKLTDTSDSYENNADNKESEDASSSEDKKLKDNIYLIDQK